MFNNYLKVQIGSPGNCEYTQQLLINQTSIPAVLENNFVSAKPFSPGSQHGPLRVEELLLLRPTEVRVHDHQPHRHPLELPQLLPLVSQVERKPDCK